MYKLDLDFENGFWIPLDWIDRNSESGSMWKNFSQYCREKGSFSEEIGRAHV